MLTNRDLIHDSLSFAIEASTAGHVNEAIVGFVAGAGLTSPDSLELIRRIPFITGVNAQPDGPEIEYGDTGEYRTGILTLLDMFPEEDFPAKLQVLDAMMHLAARHLELTGAPEVSDNPYTRATGLFKEA